MIMVQLWVWAILKQNQKMATYTLLLQNNVVAKTMFSGVRLAEFIYPNLSLDSYMLWANYFIFLYLNFHISKMKIIVVQASMGCCEE